MKRDGHSHTEFCPHASGKEAEEYVREAIDLGIEVYSFTEHAPYTEKIYSSLKTSDEKKDQNSMKMSDLRYYLNEMERLKRRYFDKITLLVGLEVDYFEGLEDETRDILNEYGGYLDDSLLSVHCLDLRSIDYNLEETEALYKEYGSYKNFCQAYYDALKKSVKADLGKYKPKRISHPSLCRRFRTYLKEEDDGDFIEDNRKNWEELLDLMVANGYEMDLNLSGYRKEECQEVYPPKEFIEMALKKGVKLVPGSDSHDPSDLEICHKRDARRLKREIPSLNI